MDDSSTLGGIKMKGISHKDIGPELTRTEWEAEDAHDISEGTSFPESPAEKDTFYRTDLHMWFQYNGSFWVSLTTRGERHLTIPVNAEWIEDNVNGGVTYAPTRLVGSTTATASSRASAYALIQFLCGSDRCAYIIDWDKHLTFAFSILRYTSDAEVVARVQLKEIAGEGNLTGKGIGILVKNYAIFGEAYDTAREEVDLSITMTDYYPYMIKIEHDPGTGVRFYVNNVLVGTSTREPSGSTEDFGYQLMMSIINGETGGVDAMWVISPIEIWQEI